MSECKNKIFYLYLIIFVAIILEISIILGILTDYFFEVEKEIITNVSGTITVAMVTFTALIAVLFVFRLQILIDNQKSCGFRKRRFLDEVNEVRIKNKLGKISDDTEEIEKEWPKFRESFIKKKGKGWYALFFNSVGGRELDELAERYDKILDNRDKIESCFKRSLSLSFLVIILSLILLLFGDFNLTYSIWIPTFIILEILLTILFICIIMFDIKNYILKA